MRTFAPIFASIIGLAVALQGCHREDSAPKESAPAEPPALAKLEEAKPLPAIPAPPAPKKLDAPSQPEPSADADADGDQESADEQPEEAKPNKKRRASKGSRRRSRSHSDEESAEVASSKGSKVKNSKDAVDGAPLSLKRIQFAEAIKDREPVDPEETFSMTNTGKLYAFLELSNQSEEEEKVTVTFVPPMGGATKVTLDVGPQKRWRTWALRKAVSAPGTWRVVVRDSHGKELGSRTFEVTE